MNSYADPWQAVTTILEPKLHWGKEKYREIFKKIFFSGSQSVFTMSTPERSDIDIMCVFHDQGLKDLKLCPENTFHLSFRPIPQNPAYIRLCAIDSDGHSTCLKSAEFKATLSDLFQYDSWERCSNEKVLHQPRHMGAALTMEDPLEPVDLVFVIEVPFKDTEPIFKRWLTRVQNKLLLNERQFSDIKDSFQCYLVPKGINEEDQENWRLSFSTVETALYTQYSLFKKLAYTHAKHTLTTRCTIPSFWLKYAFFWLYEDCPQFQRKFTDRDDHRLARHLFTRLFLAIIKGHLPHYFLPEQNLLQAKSATELRIYREQYGRCVGYHSESLSFKISTLYNERIRATGQPERVRSAQSSQLRSLIFHKMSHFSSKTDMPSVLIDLFIPKLLCNSGGKGVTRQPDELFRTSVFKTYYFAQTLCLFWSFLEITCEHVTLGEFKSYMQAALTVFTNQSDRGAFLTAHIHATRTLFKLQYTKLTVLELAHLSHCHCLTGIDGESAYRVKQGYSSLLAESSMYLAKIQTLYRFNYQVLPYRQYLVRQFLLLKFVHLTILLCYANYLVRECSASGMAERVLREIDRKTSTEEVAPLSHWQLPLFEHCPKLYQHLLECEEPGPTDHSRRSIVSLHLASKCLQEQLDTMKDKQSVKAAPERILVYDRPLDGLPGLETDDDWSIFSGYVKFIEETFYFAKES